jgi:hypothetical protein
MTDSLSDSLASFEDARARCQAKYDAMTPIEGPEPVPCIVCGGAGKLGCMSDCIQPEPVPDYCPKCSGGPNCYHLDDAKAADAKWQENERFCIKHHACHACRGTGDFIMTDADLRADADSDREDARNG